MYKRQAKAGGKSDFCYSHIGFPEKLSTFIQAVLIQIEIWTLAEISGKEFAAFAAVSYTHLDVYKRQIYRSACVR